MAPTVELHIDDAEHRLESSVAGEVRVSVDRQSHGVLEIAFELISTASTGRPRALALFGSSRVIREGLWEPGEIAAHRFEVPAPDAPPSFRGDEIALTWRLIARLTIAETDEVAGDRAEVTLRAGEGDWLKMEREGEVDPGAVTARPKAPLAISVATFVVGGAAVIAGLATSTIALAIPGGLVWLGALLAMWWAARQWRRMGVVGDVQVAVEPRHGSPPVHAITAHALPGAPIERAWVDVAVRERSEVGTGDSRTVRTAEVWSRRVELAPAGAGNWRGELALPGPDQVPPALTSGSRTIHWSAEVVLVGASDLELWRAPVVIRNRLARAPS